MDNFEQLKTLMAERTGTRASDWFPTFRARESMQVVFAALRDRHGDGSVLTQAFTCSTVPEAMIAAVVKPVYSEIDKDTLSLDATLAQQTDTSLAVHLQHTFGIIDEKASRDIAKASQANGVLLMEDAAHCVGRMARAENGLPLADVSVHSFGVEKITPTSFGAITWVNPKMADEALRDDIVSRLSRLPKNDPRVENAVKSYRNRLRILSHIPAAVRKPLRRKWADAKKFIPAVSEEELAGGTLLTPSLPGNETLSRCVKAAIDLDNNEQSRTETVSKYIAAFADASDKYHIPTAAKNRPAPLLQFPLIFDDANLAAKIVAGINEAGIYATTWGRPLLFPGVTDRAAFFFADEGAQLPITRHCSDGLVLLPTNRSKEDTEKAISIVKGLL